MTTGQAIILGIIEGLTEFLPISSTGHLMLGAYLLKLGNSNFLNSFQIIIQLGAIASVVFLYWRRLILDWKLLTKVAFAFLPTAIIGFGLYKIIKTYFLVNNWLVVGALFLGGIIIILFEILLDKKPFREEQITSKFDELSYRQSFIIGLCQSLAIIPGVSRSGATIIGGLALKISRVLIVEFSFLLAVPTMVAATGYDFLKNYQTFSTDNLYLLVIGFLTSFLVAILAIKGFLSYVQKNNFIVFGVYRLLIALAFAIAFIL